MREAWREAGPLDRERIMEPGSSAPHAARWKSLRKVYSIMLGIEDSAIVVALIVMVFSIFLQVIYRYVLTMTLVWSEELARYLMVSSTFIGAGLGIAKESHIRMNLIRSVVRGENQTRIVNVFVNLFGLIFCIIFAGLSYQILKDVTEFGHRSPAINLPMYLPFGAMFAGILLMILHCAVNFLQAVLGLKGKEDK
jgi:TRAP-type C4-dicarboxylate transport system permease small subunit